MNKKGHPGTLVASHPGNVNAVKHGAHSQRMIEPRAAEIEAELIESFELSPVYRLAAREAARNMALLEAMDNYLDEQGLTDRRGKPRYLLEQRARTSRQLGYWVTKLSPELERQQAAAQWQVEATSLSPKRGAGRLEDLLVAAVEIDAFAQLPAFTQALEAKGWAPPRRKLSPESIDQKSPRDIPVRGEQNDGPRERGDGHESAATSPAQPAEGTPPASREPELPPGTVAARVPPLGRS